MEGDGEANYAHYALHKLKILPHELINLPRQERAFIYASTDIVVEKESKEAKKLKNKKG